MRTISLMTARREFSKLIDDVERGEAFVITRDGRSIAKLSPHVADRKATPEWEEAYRRIAGVIVEAGFDREEALAIYQEDVTPAFAINLLSSTGEWSGWPEEYVRERVIEARRSRVRGALLRFAFRRHVDEEWSQVSRYL